MTRSNTERLLKWLQDAYAMEQEASTMLTATAGRLEHYPQLKARIEQHITETKGQSEQVKRCIDLLGGTTPAIKGALASVMATVHAAGNSMMSDEVAKSLGISYAFEHLEVASYRALVIAAKQADQPQIAEICSTILDQEIAMAEWLIEHQEATVLAFLERERTDAETAKR
ncbi:MULTISPECIES: ferritin-like domain-containing protein [Xanthomonas translucens group]|uniref:ferritin-like domain-containing protein n=1 Tax=Xanthomonas translucens group TaxID=3390202 RepID=UPI0005797A1A|nr:ferritin-like domain-containing protein [Xanthomonas translucens]UKE47638.1 ferritin-like domain-containing protein [Xanthomonas translucens pv. cerealis]